MKLTNFKILTLATFCFLFNPSFAQIGAEEAAEDAVDAVMDASYKPPMKFTTNIYSANYYFSALSQTTDANGMDIPMTHHWRIGLPIKRIEIMNFASGINFNYGNKNFSAGLTVPVKNISYLLDNHPGDSLIKHSVWSVSPTLDLKVRVYKKLSLLVGGSYDYNFTYRERPGRYGVFQDFFKYPVATNKDINAINQTGLVARAGINVRFGPANMNLVYNHRLYDLFNQDYIDANSNTPYAGWKTKIGYVSFERTIDFSMFGAAMNAGGPKPTGTPDF